MKIRLNKSLTLLELLIALSLFSVIMLAVASIQYFSRFHVVTSERQSLLQNEISFALEHMSKYVSQGAGPLALERATGPANGFRVRVDRNSTPTPADTNDDNWISYRLTGNPLRLTCSCATISASSPSCANFIGGDLASHIRPGVSYNQIPSPLPANPSGFYINITNPGPSGGSMIELALVARWQPANPVSLDNPQVVMKTSLYARGSATH